LFINTCIELIKIFDYVIGKEYLHYPYLIYIIHITWVWYMVYSYIVF